MDTVKNHLSNLIKLSVIDKSFDEKERTYIVNIGKANGLSDDEIESIIKKELNEREHLEQIKDLNLKTFHEKFEYLYQVLQLMKLDHKIYLSEIRFCENIAQKLGFKKGVVKALSSYIYASPNITADREILQQKSLKYLIS